MEYDEVGVPHVRVRLGADNITITGNVNLIDNVYKIYRCVYQQ